MRILNNHFGKIGVKASLFWWQISVFFVCTFLVSTHQISNSLKCDSFPSLFKHLSNVLTFFSYELDSALIFSDTGVIKEFWCIQCTGKGKGNDFHKTWMGSNNVVKMYGDSLQDKYLSSKNKTCPYWFLSYWWCRGNMQFSRHATCGSRLPSGSQTIPH